MTPPVVQLSNIRLGPEDNPILENINLSLEAGHFLGIVGPNGAGKSSLLNIVAGILNPDDGHIDLFGQCLRRFNHRSLLKNVGFLHQLHDHQPRLPMRVRDVVAMGLTDFFHPLRGQKLPRKTIIDTLALMDMQHLADADYRHLSGGQRQRVRIARALVHQPRLLLLDEPSAALDSARQEKLFRLLRQLCDDTGMSIIMVEHDIAAISSYVDSVACLNKRIHHHAMRGEEIPENVWQTMYGEHIHIMRHDAACIGCDTLQTHEHSAHD